jgi:DNA-binding PadR family transcriptional regulator
MSTAGTLDRLDPLLEHRIRLTICVLLARTQEICFARFKETLEATDGNLGAQLRKLEEAGYLTLQRTFERRRPVTWYRLTEVGRTALERHVHALDHLLGDIPRTTGDSP